MSRSTTNSSKETRLAPEPLTTCPKCTYALKGLPSAHRCPECGFEYDEYSWSWKMPEKKWRRARIFDWVMLSIPIFAIGPQIFLRGAFKFNMNLGFLQLFLLIILLTGLILWIRWIFFISERFVLVVTEKGVTFRGKVHGPYARNFIRLVPWDEVLDVKKGSGLHIGGYWLYRYDGKKEILHHMFTNQTEWEVLRQALLDAKAHYLSQEPSNEL